MKNMKVNKLSHCTVHIMGVPFVVHEGRYFTGVKEVAGFTHKSRDTIQDRALDIFREDPPEFTYQNDSICMPTGGGVICPTPPTGPKLGYKVLYELDVIKEILHRIRWTGRTAWRRRLDKTITPVTLDDWTGRRNDTKMSNKIMGYSIKTRLLLLKVPKKEHIFHYGNENNLCYEVTEMTMADNFRKLNIHLPKTVNQRDVATYIQLTILDQVQISNSALMDAGLSYSDRKRILLGKRDQFFNAAMELDRRRREMARKIKVPVQKALF